MAGQVTAHGSLAHGGPAAEDAEVVRAAARRRRRRCSARRTCPSWRRWPRPSRSRSAPRATRGTRAHRRRLQRRLGRRRRRRARRRGARHRRRRLDPHPRRLLRPVRPQAAARPRADGARLARHVGRPARSRAACSTPRCSSTPSAGRRRRSPRRRGARAGRAADRVLARRCRAARPRGSDDEQRARGRAHRRARLRDLGHAVEERDPDYGNARQRDDALPRGRQRRRRRRWRIPSGSRAGRAGSCGMGERHAALAGRAARTRQEAADRERIGALFADFDVLLTPALTRRPPLLGEWLGLPAPLMLNGDGELHRPPPAVEPHRPARRRGAGRGGADGFPLAVQLVGRAGRRGDAALALRPARGRHGLARAPPAARRMSAQDELLALATASPTRPARSCATRSAASASCAISAK